jgi:hypothetical protein
MVPEFAPVPETIKETMAVVLKLAPVKAGRYGACYYCSSKQLQGLARKGRDRRKWN